jgi:hypothetical protein
LGRQCSFVKIIAFEMLNGGSRKICCSVALYDLEFAVVEEALLAAAML